MAEIDEEQFKLYVRMSKILAIKLEYEKDRIIASKWVKKIESTTEPTANKTRNHVMQLLLMSLMRKRLVGPFEKPPQDDEELISNKWAYQPHDIVKLTKEKEFELIGKPEIQIEMSGDLCEYLAYQPIPFFGTHFYYAYSPEKIRKWGNLDKKVIPKGLLNITVMEPKQFVKPKKKKKDEEKLGDNSDFLDKTVLDNTGKFKEKFVAEQPNVEKEMPTKLLQEGITSGILQREDIDLEICEDRHKDNPVAQIEKVKVTKNKKKIINESKIKKASGKDKEFLEKLELEVLEAEKIREKLLSKMPAHLRERLSRKYKKPEVEENICDPNMFERGQQKECTTPQKRSKSEKSIDADIRDSFERPWQKYIQGRAKPQPISPTRRNTLINRLQCLKNQQPVAPPTGVVDDDINIAPPEIVKDEMCDDDFSSDLCSYYDINDPFRVDKIAKPPDERSGNQPSPHVSASKPMCDDDFSSDLCSYYDINDPFRVDKIAKPPDERSGNQPSPHVSASNPSIHESAEKSQNEADLLDNLDDVMQRFERLKRMGEKKEIDKVDRNRSLSSPRAEGRSQVNRSNLLINPEQAERRARLEDYRKRIAEREQNPEWRAPPLQPCPRKQIKQLDNRQARLWAHRKRIGVNRSNLPINPEQAERRAQLEDYRKRIAEREQNPEWRAPQLQPCPRKQIKQLDNREARLGAHIKRIAEREQNLENPIRAELFENITGNIRFYDIVSKFRALTGCTPLSLEEAEVQFPMLKRYIEERNKKQERNLPGPQPRVPADPVAPIKAEKDDCIEIASDYCPIDDMAEKVEKSQNEADLSDILDDVMQRFERLNRMGGNNEVDKVDRNRSLSSPRAEGRFQVNWSNLLLNPEEAEQQPCEPDYKYESPRQACKTLACNGPVRLFDRRSRGGSQKTEQLTLLDDEQFSCADSSAQKQDFTPSNRLRCTTVDQQSMNIDDYLQDEYLRDQSFPDFSASEIHEIEVDWSDVHEESLLGDEIIHDETPSEQSEFEVYNISRSKAQDICSERIAAIRRHREVNVSDEESGFKLLHKFGPYQSHISKSKTTAASKPCPASKTGHTVPKAALAFCPRRPPLLESKAAIQKTSRPSLPTKQRSNSQTLTSYPTIKKASTKASTTSMNQRKSKTNSKENDLPCSIRGREQHPKGPTEYNLATRKKPRR